MIHVLNVTWAIHWLSPLFGFCTKSINKYCEEFQHYLQQVDLDRFSRYKFSFSSTEDFENESDETTDIILLATNEKNKIALNVILHSVPRSNSMSKYQFIPFLLIGGKKLLQKQFLLFVQSRFSCCIDQVALSKRDILELGLFNLNTNHGAGKDFTLAFSVPMEICGIQTIEISIRADACYKLWYSILETEDETKSRINTFVSALKEYIEHYFKMDITVCKLYEIRTPVLTATSSGLLKVSDADVVKPIFRHLRFRLKQMLDLSFHHVI